jgi:hypothetical protein
MTLPDITHSRDYLILKGRVGEDYARELVVESAIDPAVALERGYWVAMNRLDLKHLGFTRIYRRIEVPALVIPRRSPDGETTRYQIKPRVPMQTKGGKYLFPPHEEMIVDVHPRSLESLKDPSVPLWVTEGSKGGDSLVSQGLCAVALAGVYNFAVKDTKSKVLLPCWDHINLESRRVIVAYDANAQTSDKVQEALNRLVNRLSERGANVWVVYIPPVNGNWEAGVDDFLADGGHPHDLLAQAVPFVPTDVSHERLARDPVLKENIEVMEACLLGENWSRRGVARKVLKALILTSRRQGMMEEKHFLAEDGSRYKAQCILMRRASRTLAEDGGVSLSSVTKGIEALEKRWGSSRGTTRYPARGTNQCTSCCYLVCCGIGTKVQDVLLVLVIVRFPLLSPLYRSHSIISVSGTHLPPPPVGGELSRGPPRSGSPYPPMPGSLSRGSVPAQRRSSTSWSPPQERWSTSPTMTWPHSCPTPTPRA